MTPLEIACRHLGCDAQAGESCVCSSDLCNAKIPHRMSMFHSERIEDAAAMTTGEGEPTIAQLDKAVEDLI